MTVETKTGLFFVLGMILLGIFTFKVEELGKIFEERYILTTDFSHAGGLEEGDPVAIAGVKVGVVRSLKIEGRSVHVVMEVDAREPVYPGADATVEWAGLLGRKYVDISVGDTSKPRLASGRLVRGISAPTVGDVMSEIGSVASTVADFLGGETGASLKDVGPRIGKALDSVAGLGDDLKRMTPKIDKALDGFVTVSQDLKEGRGTIGKLFASDELYNKLMKIADELDKGSASITALSQNLDKKLGPILDDVKAAAPDLKPALESIRKVADTLEKGEGTLPKLLNDKELYAQVKESVENIRSFSERLKSSKEGVMALLENKAFADDLRQTAAQLRELATQLNEGKGTLPKLIRDDDLYNDIKKLIADAQAAIRGVQEQIPVGTFTSVLFSAF